MLRSTKRPANGSLIVAPAISMTRRATPSTRWLRKSPEHLRAYLELAAIWNEGPLLDPEGKFDRDTLIARAAFDRDNVVELSNSPQQSRPRAACIAARAAHALAPALRRPTSPVSTRRLAAIAASIVFASPPPHSLPARLFRRRPMPRRLASSAPSPSRTDRRSNSIRVRRSWCGTRRKGVSSNFFKAKRCSASPRTRTRPFIVKTGATLVRAVGTEFDVYQKRDGTVVTVVEGRVAILTDHSIALPDHGVPATAIDEPHQSNLEFPTIAPGQIGNILVAAGEQLTVTPKVDSRSPSIPISPARLPGLSGSWYSSPPHWPMSPTNSTATTIDS